MSRRSWIFALPVVGAAALILRGGYLWELHGSLLMQVVTGDAKQYDQWAQGIVGGDWLGSDVFYQTPLYPYLLAIVFKIVGHDLFVVRSLQATLGALGCVVTAQAARKFFGDRAGLWTGGLLACYSPAIFFDGLLQKASLDFFLMAVVLWFVARLSEQRRWRDLVGAGLVIGLFTLNRENARVLYPIVVALLLSPLDQSLWRRRALHVAVFTAAMACVLVPVAARNYYVGREFLISTSQLGPNFYIGNHAGARGGYEELALDRGSASHERADATRIAEEAVGHSLTPSQVSNFWVSRSWDYISSEPGSWLALLGRKLLLSLNDKEIADTESLEAYARHSRILSSLRWFGLGVLLPLAALGVWLTRSRWRRLAVLHAILLAIPVSVALFYVLARYRFPMVPVAAMFAGAAVAAISSAVKHPWGTVRTLGRSGSGASQSSEPLALGPRDWLIGAVILLGAGLLTRLPVVPPFIDQTNLNVGAELVSQGRASEALPLLEAAAKEEPSFAPNRYNLGLAYYQLRRAGEAQLEFDAALRSRPNYVEALNALGVVMLEHRDAARAVGLFRKATEVKPASAQLYRNLGDALTAVGGRMPDSIAAYERSLELEPKSLNTLYKLAVAYAEIGRTSAAVETLNRAVAVARQSGSAGEEARINKAIQSLRSKPR